MWVEFYAHRFHGMGTIYFHHLRYWFWFSSLLYYTWSHSSHSYSIHSASGVFVSTEDRTESIPSCHRISEWFDYVLSPNFNTIEHCHRIYLRYFTSTYTIISPVPIHVCISCTSHVLFGGTETTSGLAPCVGHLVQCLPASSAGFTANLRTSIEILSVLPVWGVSTTY